MVIATALLAIIGLIGGYLLSERRGSGTSVPKPSPTLSLLPAYQACLDRTQEMGAQFGANGELRQVLRVRTESRAVIWVCQDADGALYYHANKGGAEAPWVENRTALFLAGVRYDGVGAFTATANDGATFTVSLDRLVITHKDGTVEEQAVVQD
ncbi:hypothetical protein Q0Z83_076980 [Actinoplanes sichuanensis]|uniref:Uncharacterized protein n=1 Tax=Actinoplanes sichuanensis TaxID=512349 RepID=A0ABW4AE69_9ACTN|nr:hypothetical protein [Actinoplanes sichuanensis]BEL09507.1 hypothetical protein Q0Z83_076980 [Actinoplanes sichuanensis]